jgi:transglutaminase-like putative cysteine protease
VSSVTLAVERRLVALTALAAGLAIAVAAPPAIAALAVALPLVALAVGPALELDRVAQAALTTGALAAGVVAARLGLGDAPAAGGMLSDRTLLLGLPMLAAACARAVVARPVYGAPVTLAAVLVALTAAGRAPTGIVYPALTALSLAVGFLALRASDPARAPLRTLGLVHWLGLAAAVAVTAAGAYGTHAAVPRLRDYVMARVAARWDRQQTGFSDAMWLGALSGLAKSDKVVLRVRGDAPELLRGGVLGLYGAGRWEVALDAGAGSIVETPREPASLEGLVELEHATGPERYFLPLGANEVVVSEGVYARDAHAVARAVQGFGSKRVWYRSGPSEAARASLDEGGPLVPRSPTLGDLHVPSRLAPQLVALLAEWSIDNRSPKAALRAIEERLARDYRYALEFERTPGVDPVIDFLTTNREGHCEYFASALALLGRAARIPTRVVVGYRVVERSPLGYHIVRERNAHSWVEAWIDDRWITFDPTPASDAALVVRETPRLGALADGLATGWERVDDWLARRTPFEFAAALVALVAVFSIYRALRGRSEGEPTATVEAPLPAFERLAEALGARGIRRVASEPLERLATRARSSRALPSAVCDEVERAIARYAAHRYGGQADDASIGQELVRVAAVVRQGATDGSRPGVAAE